MTCSHPNNASITKWPRGSIARESAKTRKLAGTLRDEAGRQVQSEKLLEIDFSGGVPVRAGDQFGIGRAAP